MSREAAHSVLDMTVPQVDATAVRESEPKAPTRRRVFMMDLLSIVPYYTGHLSLALKQMKGLQVDIGSITYHLDRGFFSRQQLRTDPGFLDVASKVSSIPAGLRRVLKVIECLMNMVALLIRFWFSKPDVIHVQFLPMVKFGFPFELWFLRIVTRMRIKLVYTVHNVLPQDTGERYRTVYNQIYALADRLICHDVCAQDRLVQEFGVTRTRISIIPHGPLFEQSLTRTRDDARRELNIAGDQCVVLWQGILRPYKGVSFLLNAWQQIQSRGLDTCLAVVGNGDEGIVKAIEDEVSSLGISSSVRLELRFVSVAELKDYYLAADILVYPYSEVTTSGALMTGIGYGKPIVASRLPAFEQLLQDGENALLVNYGEVGELAETITRLIDQPELRQRLGESARRSYLKGPQWPEIAQQTLACYESSFP